MLKFQAGNIYDVPEKENSEVENDELFVTNVEVYQDRHLKNIKLKFTIMEKILTKRMTLWLSTSVTMRRMKVINCKDEIAQGYLMDYIKVFRDEYHLQTLYYLVLARNFSQSHQEFESELIERFGLFVKMPLLKPERNPPHKMSQNVSRYEVRSYNTEVDIWFSKAIGRPCTLLRNFGSSA
ncbi:hypothetical protein BC332_13394 [Capsicum chinense]|nr:hypothetical protein BC332_13394 [Capsicum chinense]